MRRLRVPSMVVAALLLAALAAGFVAGWAVIVTANAVLPPFGPGDDDTLRERVPVALAYAVWLGTSLLVLRAGWRLLSRRRPIRPTPSRPGRGRHPCAPRSDR